MKILTIRNLAYNTASGVFKKANKQILKGISFEIEEGEIIAIAGESGGGKTTLSKIISGVITDYTGEVFYNNELIFDQKQIQMLPQNSREILNPLRRIHDLLIDPLYNNSLKNEVENKIESLLDFLKFDKNILDKFASNLSGGELQRIALGRLLLIEPKMLILDEPFSAQDVIAQKNLIQLLKKINEERNKTLVIVSHNLTTMKNFAHRIIVLKNGAIIENDLCDKILNNPANEYTQQLIRSEKFDLN